MNLPFTKMHGLGNDFVVLDATREPLAGLLRAPPPALLARLADRRFGVGCDQILVIDPPPAADLDFGYRIFNTDGSESGQCANGVRCVARYIREHGLSSKDRLRVRTFASLMELHLLDDGRVRVNMGAPVFAPARIPLALPGVTEAIPLYATTLPGGAALEFGAVSMGNPHAVMEAADVATAPVAGIGEALQHHPAFPERVNAGFMQFLDREHAKLRVYERGSGETLACGSGACAAMVVGRVWGRLAPKAAIALPGGTLELQWDGSAVGARDLVWMTGAAETVFEGSLEWPNR
jgi:diaminopimelate epimerase